MYAELFTPQPAAYSHELSLNVAASEPRPDALQAGMTASRICALGAGAANRQRP